MELVKRGSAGIVAVGKSRTGRTLLLASAVLLLTAVPALAVPNPGTGTAPPGSNKFDEILSWGAWVVFACCVGGVLFSAAKMAFSHSQGGYGGQQQTQLLYVLAGCVLAGCASAIVGALA